MVIGIITLVTVLVILGAVFFWIRPQNDPLLIGSWWRLDGSYTLVLNEDGSGRIEPDVPSITWRTRNGQLILVSMGVERYYSYSVSDGVKLVLGWYCHDGRPRGTMYVRIDE